MNETTQTTTGTVKPSIKRTDLSQLISRLNRLRSTITAFRLAAWEDRHGRSALFWPDLMRNLEEQLPNEEDLQRLGTASVFEISPPDRPLCGDR